VVPPRIQLIKDFPGDMQADALRREAEIAETLLKLLDTRHLRRLATEKPRPPEQPDLAHLNAEVTRLYVQIVQLLRELIPAGEWFQTLQYKPSSMNTRDAMTLSLIWEHRDRIHGDPGDLSWAYLSYNPKGSNRREYLNDALRQLKSELGYLQGLRGKILDFRQSLKTGAAEAIYHPQYVETTNKKRWWDRKK